MILWRNYHFFHFISTPDLSRFYYMFNRYKFGVTIYGNVSVMTFYSLIPTFHWTAFLLRSLRSRSFSKIVSNRSRSVDSHTIWGLHASNLRFHYASITLLLRCCRAAHDSVALSLRFCYDPATTMKVRLRSVYANGDAATRLLRHPRRS